MTSYRYLGSATTDANGIAKYNFTGSGAGEIDFIASLDNPMTSGSIVSGTYSVLDCIFYDIGTTGNVNSGWVNKNATLSSEGGTDGTLFSNSGESFGAFYANKNGTSGSSWSDLYDYQADLKIEFDIVSITGTNAVMLNDGVTPSQVVLSSYSASDNDHIIITVESNRWKIKVGNNQESDWVSHSLATDFGIAFRVNGSSSIKFKNFEIYPI